MVSRGIAGTRMTTCRSRVVQALRGDAVAASEISLPLLLSRMYTDRAERISSPSPRTPAIPPSAIPLLLVILALSFLRGRNRE
jgi:hypothetical protein